MATQTMLEIRYEENAAIVKIGEPRIQGDAAVKAISDQLISQLSDHGKKWLVLDLSAVEYFSSMMFGEIIRINGKLQRQRGGVVVCGLRPTVRELFRVARLDLIFPIAESVENAIKSIRAT